jgi:hypothetical protein
VGGRVELLTAIDQVYAVVGDRPPPLPRQELYELDRIERIRRHDALDTYYAITRGAAGRIDGFLPLYPTPRARAGQGVLAKMRSGTDAIGWSTALLLGSDGSAPNSLVATPRVAADLVAAAALETRAGLKCLPHADGAQWALVADALPAARWSEQREEAYFDVSFDSFDAYAATLSRSRRSQMRRERRRFLGSGVTLRALPATEAVGLAPLLTQVERRYNADASVRRERLYLWSTAVAMGDAGTALVAYDGDEPVAFTILWRVGEYWRVRCWGCDYGHAAVRAAALYPNLMFYEPMLRASAAGVRRLVVGTGSLESKLIRGARLRGLRSVAWT